MKKWLFLALLVLGISPGHSWAQTWPGQCPTGTITTAIGCQPEAVSPQPTDLVLGWQIGQASPHTRAFQIQQIISATGGQFLPLAGGTMTGTLRQTIATIWSGNTYPGTNNVTNYSTQTYMGTPTAGFSDSFGTEIPLNLGFISSDQLNWNPGSPGAVFGWLFKHQFGGGSANGARTTLSVDATLTGAIGTANTNFGAIQATVGATHNVTGATSGTGGLGDFFTYTGYWGGFTSGVFAHGAAAWELDYVPQAGSTINYVDGIKIVNFSPLTYHATTHEAVLAISTQSSGVTGTWNHIITFGDPQSPGGGFPGSATGDLITASTGTTTNVMDFSALTISGSLLKGPGGLNITGTGNINTAGFNYISLQGGTTGNAPTVQSVGLDAVVGLNFKLTTGLTGKFGFLNGNNDQQFEINSIAAAISRLSLAGAATGTNIPLDVAGTATGITLGAGTATLVRIGSATADQILGSGVFLPALNTTTGFAHLPFTNASSGAGGIPTGTPANTSGPACEFNDVTFTINCWSPSAAAWKHVTLSASAG